jgi:U3 small nucleolar RNA-associated protein 13
MGKDDGGGEVVTSFCLHPNGTEVVVATQNFLLRHWRLAAAASATTAAAGGNECLRAIRGHTMPVQCMVYDPTGTLVATGSADRTVRVWDIERGYCTHHFRDHTDVVRSLVFHPGA